MLLELKNAPLRNCGIKVIEHCNECQFAKRFNDANANIGCVFVCMKASRLIIHEPAVSHFSNVEPLDIPDWCELEEYTGDKGIPFFDE